MEEPAPHARRKLSDFIRSNLEPILQEWEQFAKKMMSGRKVSPEVLRDHAAGMLLTIADEIECPEPAAEAQEQEEEEQRTASAPRALETEAERHGAARVAIGFSVSETVAEFRALRESVLRLWAAAYAEGDRPLHNETTRFIDAIDQALAESLERYSLDKEESMHRFDTLLSESPDLQFILDSDGRFIYANEALAKVLKMPRRYLIGKDIGAACQELAAPIRHGLAQTVSGVRPTTSEVVCHADPQVPVAYRVVLLPVVDGRGTVESVSCTARNISELKASEEKIVRQAYYDSLTGLPNRSLFLDRLDQETRHGCRNGRRFALLYVDLDGFKGVNDRYGHAEGDLLLEESARRLSSCVRTSDTVARLGGDEFIIILSDFARYSDIEGVARQILAALSRPFAIRGNEVRISCSIGITLYPDDARLPDELIRNADQAMFVAKKAGRDRYSYFTPDLRESASARLKTIDELRHALANGELAVYYQPIVDLESGRIVKAEALLRWHHPEWGLVLPSEFISLAEETGLIREIGSLVLDEVVIQVRRWSLLRGAPFPVSINKSPVEFMDSGRSAAGEHDQAALHDAGKLITVEITEGVMLNDAPPVRDKLRRMREAGVQLAIDDFGVGYSSMAMLKSFKVDYLKIDQSFVRDMLVNDESRVFAETIISMAHKLGMQVIAEGIETAEQHAWLKDSGCDFGQGFLFSPATDAEHFEQLLARNERAGAAPASHATGATPA